MCTYIRRQVVVFITLVKEKADRAWSTKGRSKFWNRYSKKYGCVIEIVAYDLQEWYSLELEQELILKYGRLNLDTGQLINLTDGGDGLSGYLYTKEQRERISNRQIGKANPCYDHTVYNYYNINTKEYLDCTQQEFEVKTKGWHISTQDDKSSNGWCRLDVTSSEYIKRVENNNKGIYSSHASTEKHSFVCTNTLLPCEMTIQEFVSKTGSPPHVLLNGKCKTFKGYTTREIIDRLGIDSALGLNRDIETYSIVNSITKEVLTGKRPYLEKETGCRMSCLVNNIQRYSNGWYMLSNEEHESSEFYACHYSNNKGETFVGTRTEFKEKYKFSISGLYGASRTMFCKGWFITKNNPPLLPKYIIHNFKHADGETFTGTRAEFTHKYNLDISSLFKTKQIKSSHGWTVDK